MSMSKIGLGAISLWDMDTVSNGGASFVIASVSTDMTAGYLSNMRMPFFPGWKACDARLTC